MCEGEFLKRELYGMRRENSKEKCENSKEKDNFKESWFVGEMAKGFVEGEMRMLRGRGFVEEALVRILVKDGAWSWRNGLDLVEEEEESVFFGILPLLLLLNATSPHLFLLPTCWLI